MDINTNPDNVLMMNSSSPHIPNWIDDDDDDELTIVAGSFVETVQDMMGAVVERTPKIEQVNLTGGRLIREAKVMCC